MSVLEGATNMDKLKNLSAKAYKDQAIWFMNSFWKREPNFSDDNEKREKIWSYTNVMVELDPKGAAGCELNEFDAHRFLEKFENTMTVKEMREFLAAIDIDFNKMVSLSEYLIAHYDIDWEYLVNASQGDNNEEIEKAQALLTEAQRALGVARNKHDEASKAEDAQRKAEAELKKALAELEAQEEAYKKEVEEKTKISEDESLGVVKRGRAKAELEQLKAKDPLPLQRAKINQGAAVRKAERATEAAAKAREEAEAALKKAEDAFAEAQKFLTEAQANAGGSAEGALWWMQRELDEAKKYMPQKKGGTTSSHKYWES